MKLLDINGLTDTKTGLKDGNGTAICGACNKKAKMYSLETGETYCSEYHMVLCEKGNY